MQNRLNKIDISSRDFISQHSERGPIRIKHQLNKSIFGNRNIFVVKYNLQLDEFNLIEEIKEA